MTTHNIKPEDVKRLITKDENGLLPCPKCMGKGTMYDYSRQCVGECWSEVRCDVCHHTEDARQWNTRAYVPAILTLLRLLDEVGDKLDDIKFATHSIANTFAGEELSNACQLAQGSQNLYIRGLTEEIQCAIQPYRGLGKAQTPPDKGE